MIDRKKRGRERREREKSIMTVGIMMQEKNISHDELNYPKLMMIDTCHKDPKTFINFPFFLLKTKHTLQFILEPKPPPLSLNVIWPIYTVKYL